jgi:hypothetical protein
MELFKPNKDDYMVYFANHSNSENLLFFAQELFSHDGTDASDSFFIPGRGILVLLTVHDRKGFTWYLCICISAAYFIKTEISSSFV